VQGGSTITQQFIKNAYLPQDERTADSLSRKLREAVLAYSSRNAGPRTRS